MSEDQVQKMVEWFHQHYEDPAESMPWDEGEYVWMVEPCYAADELTEQFGGKVSQALIDLAVEEIQREGYEWVRIADLNNFCC